MKYERVSTPEADSLDEALLPTVQRRRERRLNRHHLITYTLLFLSLVINMFLLLSVRNGVSDGNIPPNAASGLNIPWFPFPNKTLFLPHPNYESLSSSSDKLWEGLQSPNGGFYVQEVDGTRHNFGIAMFHQLHCLQNLRSGLQLLQSVVSEEDDGGISKQEGRKLLDEVHLGHCVDYLRQVSLRRLAVYTCNFRTRLTWLSSSERASYALQTQQSRSLRFCRPTAST